MLYLIVSSLFLAVNFGGIVNQEWTAWKSKFQKSYVNAVEESYRYNVWLKNSEHIAKHNEEQHSYTLAVNKFADLTAKEFSSYVNPDGQGCGNLLNSEESKKLLKPPEMITNLKPEVDLPSSVDWSNTSLYVTPIKNQGSCGSCWAFSAVGSTESAYAIATGTLNSLSEQELVDCDTSVNAGCNGGFMDAAMLYIKNNNGLALEDDYKYTATDGTCESQKYTHYDPIEGIQVVERDNDTALANAVVIGPVSVGIQANQFAFQFYSGGVLDGNCGTSIDHGVVVVGYGTDDSSKSKYWKVKNSWGTDWGEAGYVRICRECDKNGLEGECCINCQPSYPLIKKGLKNYNH